MRKRVELYIRNRELIRKDQLVLVALSGGADSVALLRVLHELGYHQHALHCNFHLRGEESNRDERFVTRLCQEQGIPLSIKHFHTREYARGQHMSIEMAARAQRYEWFREQIRAHKAQGIAVAHHRDDQAETLLLNLLRGTGLRGMAGMWSHRDGVIRPLLCVGRQDILRYLASACQDYVTDSTNLERDAIRNRIRMDVLPLLEAINPQATSALASLGNIIQGSMPHYREGIRQGMQARGITPQRFGRQWLTGTLLDRADLVAEEKGTEARMPAIEERIVDKMQPAQPDTAYFDADRLQATLHTRRVRRGDRMIPLGMKGWKLVSDLMTDRKLNRFQKERQCVVTSGEDIIWAVGLRTDNRFRVTTQTTRILQLRAVMPEP